MVEVSALLCLFYKIPLNKPNDNYCRGLSHKPPFEGLPSECDGGTPLWDMGKSLNDTHETRYMHKAVKCTHWLEPIMNTDIVCVIY